MSDFLHPGPPSVLRGDVPNQQRGQHFSREELEAEEISEDRAEARQDAEAEPDEVIDVEDDVLEGNNDPAGSDV